MRGAVADKLFKGGAVIDRVRSIEAWVSAFKPAAQGNQGLAEVFAKRLGDCDAGILEGAEFGPVSGHCPSHAACLFSEHAGIGGIAPGANDGLNAFLAG